MLHLKGITHIYPNGTKALDNCSLEIPKGMFGLLGPNGAGKSTLMRCIATLQTPSSGQILFDDLDVLAQPDQLRAVLGYLPQDFGVYPRVSAWDLLNHLAVLKGVADSRERKQVLETLLHQVNLWEVRKKAVAGFSGGMRQRFGIAQALLGKPQLIIVDEPTAGLDPEERNRFNNLLAEISDNVVVILSTHIVDDVTDLCSRMAIMVDGRIVQHGSPSELLSSVAGKIWRCTVNRNDVDDYRRRFNVISTRLSSGRTMIHVLADTLPDSGFEPVEASLQDVYFATLATSRASDTNTQAAA